MGDFNCTSGYQDKRGGHSDPWSLPNKEEFKDFVASAGLTNIKYYRSAYTWCNQRWGQNRILERLDRGLTNANWLADHPNYYIHHLPRITSDHSPMLLTDHTYTNTQTKTFRYENMWHSHHSFKETVYTDWAKLSTTNCSLDSKLSSLATYLLTWNKNSFENILAETKSVKNRIKGIQSHPNYHIFTCLQSLKKSLIDDYSEKLNQVETFWA